MKPRAQIAITAMLLAQTLVFTLAAAAETPARLSDAELQEIAENRQARQRQYPPSRRISRYLKAVTEAADQGEATKGLELLDNLNLKRLNPNERAMLFRLKAYLAYGAADYAGAIENFEKVLSEEVMKLDAENKLRYSIAQLHGSMQNWEATIAALNRWFRYIPEPDGAAYYLLGISNYQLGHVDEAIAAAATAVDKAPEPKEAWLQLLAALYIQKQDYPNAAPVLEELVMQFPKKAYWVQLSLIYGAREDHRASLAVQQVAYAQGLLTEDKEVRRLARGYLYHELPYPAAQVLTEGLEKGLIDEDAEFYELLANSWVQAREYERSLPALEKAASLSKDGNLFVRLGQVLLQREQWGDAANALQRAIAAGGLKDSGNAYLLSGIAYYNDGNLSDARRAFQQASDHDSTRSKAAIWIDHITTESEGAS